MAGKARTHLAIDQRLSGEALEVGGGRARVRLETTPEMAADELGLVHGGFLFSLADYAAMLAVNEPHVVLASAEMEFRAPVRVGESVIASALVVAQEGNKHDVEVTVEGGIDGEPRSIGRGRFRCVVTREHVLGVAEGSTREPS